MLRTLVPGVVLLFVVFWAGTQLNVHGNPVSLPYTSERANKTAHSGQNIGITGFELLNYFKTQVLPGLTSNRPHGVAVSSFYDSFVAYLSPDAGHKSCFPEGSTVSKLNRNVNPVTKVHSHNDYWRDLPLFEALCHGIASVEADVWLIDGSEELAVGHNQAFLDPEHRTLNSLYTKPLLRMLNEVNCLEDLQDHKYGVFYNSPETTLYMYIDFKSENGSQTYAHLINNHLRPLIDAGYLTNFNLQSKQIEWNPVTVVLTGDYPTDLKVLDGQDDDGILHTNQRFVFLDAPLYDLQPQHEQLSVVASASISQLLSNCSNSTASQSSNGLSKDEINCIRPFVAKAHAMNLKTRIWGVPNWPNNLRKQLWRQQVYELEVDVLNVDHLYEASQVF
ncbi:LAFA_0F15720g1_1 [Lachancea sp. 'fantastica']|nr:LAFA_0F15720g1_1 [Lachancea sp. 'fantastica']